MGSLGWVARGGTAGSRRLFEYLSGALPDQLAAAFRQGLSDGGFIDSRNVALEWLRFSSAMSPSCQRRLL